MGKVAERHFESTINPAEPRTEYASLGRARDQDRAVVGSLIDDSRRWGNVPGERDVVLERLLRFESMSGSGRFERKALKEAKRLAEALGDVAKVKEAKRRIRESYVPKIFRDEIIID